MKTTLTALAAGMALVCSSAAHSESFFQIEAGIGGAAYNHGVDGLWYQDAFQHKLDLTAPAFEVGFTGPIYQSTHWGVSWHLDWAWLGTVHTQAMATPSDANYNVATKACNGPCWPLANFLGSGHDQGFLLTIEPHLDYGGWRFGVEGGPYLHRGTWSETVLGWEPSPDGPRSNFSVRYDAKWVLGAVMGASISYRNFSLAYQYFINQTPAGAEFPPIWSRTHLLMMKFRY